MWAYYNENDAEIAAWLSNNIRAGLIAPGIVDTRSIADVQPDDLRGFAQCHFFAGIGGWSYAARLASWPDERPIWSGSCPCQPFSAAGRGAGTDDPRHLWPHLYRLVRAGRPPALVGEQVAGAAGYGWFDGVRADLAREGFASRTVDIPALAVDAPHQRNRLFWVALADAERAGLEGLGGHGHDGGGRPEPDRPIAPPDDGRDVADATRGGGPVVRESEAFRRTAGRGKYRGSNGGGICDVADAHQPFVQGLPPAGQLRIDESNARADYRGTSWWGGADWILCHDGKARRVANASAPLLVNGFPNRILAWRGFGNAIVTRLGAEVIGALMDVLP